MTDIEAQLASLAFACQSCQKCSLGQVRDDSNTKVVWSRGNANSRILVCGEAPGQEESTSGLPFVGMSGQLLDQMFAHIGLDTNQDVYVCNTIKCRPPGNRPPTDDELLLCMDWLEAQIQAIDPYFIVAVGNSALAWFSGERGITKKRGKWFKYKGKYPVIPVYHPSFLARNRYKKLEPNSPWRETRADMLAIKQAAEHGVFENAGAPI